MSRFNLLSFAKKCFLYGSKKTDILFNVIVYIMLCVMICYGISANKIYTIMYISFVASQFRISTIFTSLDLINIYFKYLSVLLVTNPYSNLLRQF